MSQLKPEVLEAIINISRHAQFETFMDYLKSSYDDAVLSAINIADDMQSKRAQGRAQALRSLIDLIETAETKLRQGKQFKR